jgi:hypothetical protein
LPIIPPSLPGLVAMESSSGNGTRGTVINPKLKIRCRAIAAIALAVAGSSCGGGGGSASAPPTPTQIVDRAVTLSWVAPTQNVDGSALTNLAGYRIHYGPRPDQLGQVLDVPNPATVTMRIEGLDAGTWYFALSAYNNVGLESDRTQTVVKTLM